MFARLLKATCCQLVGDLLLSRISCSEDRPFFSLVCETICDFKKQSVDFLVFYSDVSSRGEMTLFKHCEIFMTLRAQ